MSNLSPSDIEKLEKGGQVDAWIWSLPNGVNASRSSIAVDAVPRSEDKH